LTVTPEYLTNNLVFTFSDSVTVCGYYSLIDIKQAFSIQDVQLPAGIWLDHMFIRPGFQNRGIGSAFCNHLFQLATENKWDRIEVLVDPNAIGFYEKMGFLLQRSVPSSIVDRTTPWMTKHLNLL